jgi:hypothetical protein
MCMRQNFIFRDPLNRHVEQPKKPLSKVLIWCALPVVTYVNGGLPVLPKVDKDADLLAYST